MNSLLNLAKKICQRAVLIVGFVIFGVTGILYTLTGTPLYLLLPRKAGARLGRNTISWFFRSYLGMLEATGIVRLDLGTLDELRAQRGLVIAPNHPGMLDAVLVISRLTDITCIMKAQLWDSPILGGGARLARYIRNDAAAKLVRDAVEELREGHQLLAFPEGTRTRHGQLGEFKGGFALIARKAGVPVQTVFIETNSAFLGKGWPLLKMPDLPLYYRVRLGRRFLVEGDVKTFLAELKAYYRKELEPTVTEPAR
jgi:1-acyl-sn-glycerol-3-phosphate acyltransferase